MMMRGGFLKRFFSSDARYQNTTDKNGRKDSGVESGEKQYMIRGVEQLSERTVKDVMVPRIDAIFIALDQDKATLLKTISTSGHSRIPVYGDTIDNVVGILYVKDLLSVITSGAGFSLEQIIRRPTFVPESKRLDSLLREMRRSRVHIAIAVDEYGGVSGLVCLEDIIEEIVGDIQDEYDNEQEDIVRLGDHVFLCDARIDIDNLNQELDLHIPEDDFDTLGGFVFGLFDKIPSRYEKVSYGNTDFIVQAMEGHKIETVKVIVGPTYENGNEKKEDN